MNKIKEEALERETNASKNKSKCKKAKINKEETEQIILEGFKFDSEIIFDVRKIVAWMLQPKSAGNAILNHTPKVC